MEIILGAFIVTVVVVVAMVGGLFVLARRQGGFAITQGQTHYRAGYHSHAQSEFYSPDA